VREKAQVNIENMWKSTPLTIAMQKGHFAIVRKIFTEQDIDVENKDEEGRTILMLAISSINSQTFDFVSELIDGKHANVNAQDA